MGSRLNFDHNSIEIQLETGRTRSSIKFYPNFNQNRSNFKSPTLTSTSLTDNQSQSDRMQSPIRLRLIIDRIVIGTKLEITYIYIHTHKFNTLFTLPMHRCATHNN